MMKSLLNRFSKSGRTGSAPATPSVDIGRAIPGYRKPGTPTRAPAEAESPLLPALGETDADSHASDMPAYDDEAETSSFLHSESLTDEERAERAVSSLDDRMAGWMSRDLARLTGAWAATQSDISNSGDLILAAHDLKGMGGTYGYPAIARLCTSLCKLIETRIETGDFPLINLHVEACRAAFLQGRNPVGADAVAQSVCAALEAQVARKLAS